MPAYDPSASPSPQFANPVHCVKLARDGLVYVCDRTNDRIQAFREDGTFVKETFINKETRGSGSAWDIAFSKDAQQKYIYLADGENDRVQILDRDSLEMLRQTRVRSWASSSRPSATAAGLVFRSIGVAARGNCGIAHV